MGSASADILRLLDDCEIFVSEILLGENLSEEVEETRQLLLNNFRVVHARNPVEFPLRLDDEGSDDNRSHGRSAPSDDASEDGAPEYYGDIPPVAAQDLSNILKHGFLEKRRKDHSFFGPEWQKRWCVLNNSIFYYFGSEKDKQQKGSFYINEYSVQLLPNLRKDSRRNACFELSAPGRRSFQFTASSPQEAREWVNQINFILRDLSSSLIPFDDDEEEEGEEEEPYDDIEGVFSPAPPPPPSAMTRASHEFFESGEEGDEDIYEVLPEDDVEPSEENAERSRSAGSSSDFANYYQGLWDCRADEPDELDFQRGDLIYVVSKEYNIDGWWVGELNGAVGIVPKDFLQPAYIL